MYLDTLRLITGISDTMIDDTTIGLLAEAHGVTGVDYPDPVAWLIGADMAEVMAARAIGDSNVVQVEDIGLDARRTHDMWLTLADRLRARAADQDPGGMTVVEFQPDPLGVEAV